MTTYILAGGNDRTTEGYGERLADQITARVTMHPKILSCFFSIPEQEWPTKYAQCEEWFAKNFTSGYKYNYAQKDTFLQQIDDADVIYLHGGNTQLLFDAFPSAEDFVKRVKGKIVVGSSAGANILSKKYWSSSRAVPCKGLGILDVNIMVHYGAVNHEGLTRTDKDWQREEAEFQAFVGDGEITHLPEGEFVVIDSSSKISK
jgi:hypothetical protein